MKPHYKLIFIALLLLGLCVSGVQANAFSAYSYANGCWTATNDTYTLVKLNATGVYSIPIPGGVATIDQLLIIGAGGSGGVGPTTAGGGGGAGGLIYSTNYSVSGISSINAVVGKGGARVYSASANIAGIAGGNTSFANTTVGDGINAKGGGGGAGWNNATRNLDGGSGGGASYTTSTPGTGISGQGYRGGYAVAVEHYGTGGGGGAGSVGSNGTASVGGNGGAGLSYAIEGVSVCYAGGGGGGVYTGGTAGTATCGGTDGTLSKTSSGDASLGGGSGGVGFNTGTDYSGNGSDGIIILLYRIPVPPVASFITNTTGGYYPLPVLLNDTSANTPTSWAYGAKNVTGNDTWIPIGTDRNQTVTLGVGNWSINLTATNPSGSDISSQITYVNVSMGFIASFSQDHAMGLAPLAVTFTDTSINASASTNSWDWNFGDQGAGNTSTLQNPVHTYTTAGTYTINLTIRNTSYNLVSTKLETILVNATLAANFTGTPTTGGIPLSVAFTDTSNGVVTSWLWTFGDGNISTLQNPSHTYVNSGSYNVDLNITGPDGSTNLTKNAYITATDAPTANWTADKYYGTAPLPVVFTDASTGAGITWDWDFGDGNSSVLQNPSHTFVSNGEYQVNLTVTNGFGSSSKLRNITVSDLSSSFTGSPVAGPFPLTVAFTETTTGLKPDSFYYEFGDGNTSTSQNPTHTYVNHGYYTVNNRITNGSIVYWNNKTNYIEAWGETASFSVSNTTATDAPLVVLFTSTTSNTNATPSSYLWVFGDGTQSTSGSSVTHTYDTRFGTFNANLTTANATQGVSSTSTSTTLSRIPANTVSNISYNWVMNQVFPTTIMVKDSQTLALVGESTITVGGVTYTLPNGILSNYFEYGSHTFLVEADGYASKTTSLFIVGNSTFTILIDPINGASQTTWWTPHTVQLTVMSDSYGTRLPNVLVEAHYNESAMPTTWIETLYGIQGTAAGQMLNQSLTLGGTTGSDGTLTTSMLGSLKYDIYLTSEEYGLNRYHVSTYPSDYMLNIYVPITGQTLPTSGNNTYVYLNNTRLYMTQPNISYVDFCIDYQDFSGTTSTVSELWWFGNNNSVFGTASFINPGVSLVTNCKTLYNVRGTPVYWNYSAVTGI